MILIEITNLKLIMSTFLHPSLFKRLLAALYDSFLILATLFIAIALTLPFTKGEVAAENKIYMSLYLLIVIYVFYGWFWTHGGQTLGMRVWKQKIVQLDGAPVNWQQTLIRLLTGLPAWLLFFVGLLLWAFPDKINLAESLTRIPNVSFVVIGFIWVLLDNRSNNWRDKLSRTQIIVCE